MRAESKADRAAAVDRPSRQSQRAEPLVSCGEGFCGMTSNNLGTLHLATKARHGKARQKRKPRRLTGALVAFPGGTGDAADIRCSRHRMQQNPTRQPHRIQTPNSSAPGPIQLTLPGIEFTPRQVREHGLVFPVPGAEIREGLAGGLSGLRRDRRLLPADAGCPGPGHPLSELGGLPGHRRGAWGLVPGASGIARRVGQGQAPAGAD